MYRKLTDQEVKELSRDFLVNIDFVISHVGDGEYPCNVFGNIYSSYWQALKKAREKESNLILYEEVRDLPNGSKYTEYFIGNYYEKNDWFSPTARLTKETINSDFNMGQ